MHGGMTGDALVLPEVHDILIQTCPLLPFPVKGLHASIRPFGSSPLGVRAYETKAPGGMRGVLFGVAPCVRMHI